jgi:ATP-dependent helicase HrpA
MSAPVLPLTLPETALGSIPALPELTFPENLPVSARRADIAAALNAHQVVIVCGETGSGKTTQLPKIVLLAGRGTRGQVGMTQPRRIATKSVANRLAETQSDPEFRAYDTLILDEAHERSLNIDFLLGYLKTLLPRRPELKLT